ncbi:hypothetical protein Lfu02_67010 [Longispora fulva]|uniref:Ketosteroid isomerase-like protein n=1 Tax=Longispora fulva TaxID=619741 RepID=A0A8J7GI98_9ACTN|nr:ester cyclase [Longispora fulva]MBG6138566.1 ketosteroid isomerase-like protein [Longispora fulva]GIG62329.1 hypothetical protein Lfu02_67010 [Longispora fulva]
MKSLDAPYADWFAAADAHDTSPLPGLLTPDCELVAPGVSLRGPEQIAGWTQVFYDAFPDISHPISATVTAGDSVAVELHTVGTHTGPLVGPQGTVPPTGRPLDLRVANVITRAGDRIASLRIYYDHVEFLTQLGLM